MAGIGPPLSQHQTDLENVYPRTLQFSNGAPIAPKKQTPGNYRDELNIANTQAAVEDTFEGLLSKSHPIEEFTQSANMNEDVSAPNTSKIKICNQNIAAAFNHGSSQRSYGIVYYPLDFNRVYENKENPAFRKLLAEENSGARAMEE